MFLLRSNKPQISMIECEIRKKSIGNNIGSLTGPNRLKAIRIGIIKIN